MNSGSQLLCGWTKLKVTLRFLLYLCSLMSRHHQIFFQAQEEALEAFGFPFLSGSLMPLGELCFPLERERCICVCFYLAAVGGKQSFHYVSLLEGQECLLPSEGSVFLTYPDFSPLMSNSGLVLDIGMPCLLNAISPFFPAQMLKPSQRS